jgi:hypothetical protein
MFAPNPRDPFNTLSATPATMSHFSYNFDTESFKKKVEFPTGVFINNEFSEGSTGKTIECVPGPTLAYLLIFKPNLV